MDGFVCVSGVRIDGGHHPVGGYLLGDAPPPVGAVGPVDGFYVLAGDQGQQRHRPGGTGTEFLLRQVP